MKKQYKAPIANVINMQISSVIASSMDSVAGASGLGVGDSWNSGSANSKNDAYDEDYGYDW